MSHAFRLKIVDDDSTVLQQCAIGELDHGDDPAPDLRQYFRHKARVTDCALFE